MYITIECYIKFQVKLIILIFLDQICLKRVFPVKSRKGEQHQWILNIHIRLDTKLLGKLKGTCRGQSNLLGSQGDHPSPPELGETLVSSFSLNDNLFFWTNLLKKSISGRELKKREHPHWILHIHVSLSTKFQPKLTILTFLTKFAQKMYVQSKWKKVNSTNEFFILYTLRYFWMKTEKVNITTELCILKSQ